MFYFIFSGMKLIFKDEILMYMAQNASQFADYSLSCMYITSGFFYVYSLTASASQAASF
jgi:hypothetical protein